MDLLTTKDIHKSYTKHQALSGVSISIPQKTIFGLLGPNGAGKTTLIRIITQIINQDSGEVIFEGKPMSMDLIGRIGYLPEERGLYKKMKVGEQLLYLAQLKGLTKSDAVTRIKYWFNRLEISGWWDKNVEDLSKGMQQKVQFVATVLHKPSLIILDEPFSGFDPVNANIIKDEILQLREEGATIIFSTHRMESVEELCDHIALIHNSKKVLDGSKSEIKNNFKENLFVVESASNITLDSNLFELKEQQPNKDGQIRAEVKLLNGSSPNDLIKAILPQTTIHSFNEKIPSINDIFISQVKNKTIEITTN
uniref:ABC transporter ATP-binding protein n=1 Tax=Fulvivirga sp. TaxID=1931237 RepID=UPI004049F5DB